jgi:hypothetical protein
MPVPVPAALRNQLSVKGIAINGVLLPAEPYVNFITGVTGVDNPNFVVNGEVVGSLDLTVSGGGGGGSVTGTGLWYSTSGTLNPAAVGFSGDVFLGALSGGNIPSTVQKIQNHAVSSATPLSANLFIYNTGTWTPTALSGDVTVNAAGVTTVGALAGVTLPAPSGSNTVLTFSGGSLFWTAGGGSGITQLTTDVLAGPGSGSQVATVVGLRGNNVPAPSGSNTVLQWSGSVFTWASTASGTIGVANGGTGQTTLTAHAVLVGEGTTPIAQVGPGAAGTVFIGNGASADPSFLAPGTAGQVFLMNATPVPAWQTLSGNVVVSSSGVTTVNQVTGAIAGVMNIAVTSATTINVGTGASATVNLGSATSSINLVGFVHTFSSGGVSLLNGNWAISSNLIQIASTVVNPTIQQTQINSASAATNLRIQAQNNLGSGVGGNLILAAGESGGADANKGKVVFSLNGSQVADLWVGSDEGAPMFEWTTSALVPGMYQDGTTSALQATQMLFVAQNNAGAGAGGTLFLASGSSGSGMPSAGGVTLAVAGVPWFGLGDPSGFFAGLYMNSTSIDITGAGNFILTATQYQFTVIALTGTSGSGTTVIEFPNVVGVWLPDFSAPAPFGEGALEIQVAGFPATNVIIQADFTPTATMIWVRTSGANTLAYTANNN